MLRLSTRSYAAHHYYDQESIEIGVAGGGSLKSVGSHPATGTSLMMYESTHNNYSATSNPHQRLSGQCYFNADSTAVSSTSYNYDRLLRPMVLLDMQNPPNLIFTIYVVGPLNSAGTTAVAAGTDGVERVSDQSDTQIDGHFTFDPSCE